MNCRARAARFVFRAGLLIAASIVFVPSGAFARESALNAAFDVIEYRARIEPDIANKSLSGQVAIRFRQRTADLQTLRLNAGELQVTSVKERGIALPFRRTGDMLEVVLPKARPAIAERAVTIVYRGKPAAGMVFLPAETQVYTAFSTSQWMPCKDAPEDKATLRMTLLVPASFKVVANGHLIGERILAKGKMASDWSQEVPVSTYLFGFAAGRFREVTDQSAKPALRYLVPPAFSEEQVRQIFRETRSMIAFYEEKAGIDYPGKVYTQVLISGRAAQEADGFAVMGQGYGHRVLGDETSIWLGAHELSHQWWGNAVTNRDWTEFWLNEGVASFMNAAYFEHRFGRAAYMRDVDAARLKFEKLRDSGKDKPLVFPDWNNPSAEDRSLAYDKGAYVIHLLRERLGDAVFWEGLRRYTTSHWGKTVTSRDLQNAMEQAGGTDLAVFFAEWVYPREK